MGLSLVMMSNSSVTHSANVPGLTLNERPEVAETQDPALRRSVSGLQTVGQLESTCHVPHGASPRHGAHMTVKHARALAFKLRCVMWR